jgi:hypothetical protein
MIKTPQFGKFAKGGRMGKGTPMGKEILGQMKKRLEKKKGK